VPRELCCLAVFHKHSCSLAGNISSPTRSFRSRLWLSVRSDPSLRLRDQGRWAGGAAEEGNSLQIVCCFLFQMVCFGSSSVWAWVLSLGHLPRRSLLRTAAQSLPEGHAAGGPRRPGAAQPGDGGRLCVPGWQEGTQAPRARRAPPTLETLQLHFGCDLWCVLACGQGHLETRETHPLKICINLNMQTSWCLILWSFQQL